MEYREVVNVAREMLEDVVGVKECPVCGTDVTMLVVRSFCDNVIRWRCLGCLKLFTEGLTEC